MFLGMQEKLIVQPAPDHAARRFPPNIRQIARVSWGRGGGIWKTIQTGIISLGIPVLIVQTVTH